MKWGGLNGLVEYKKDGLSAVLQGGLSSQQYQRIDEFDVPPAERKSEKKGITGGYVKGGANYNINANHNVFFNAGYIARQPNFDAVFLNFGNKINDKVENEKIQSLELGYGFRSSIFRANVNLYMTKWDNRWLTRSQSAGGVDYVANYPNIAQLHKGIEVDFSVKPVSKLNINGMVSIGDWKYTDNVTSSLFSDNNVLLGQETLYLKDVKVGDAAQFTANLGADYEIIDNLKVDASYYFADNLYSNFSPIDGSFVKADNKGALKLPSYGLVDAGISYKYKFQNRNTASLRFNVNNIFDTEYISEANTSIFAGDAAANNVTYKGIDTANNVWFGFGRTWNVSLKYEF